MVCQRQIPRSTKFKVYLSSKATKMELQCVGDVTLLFSIMCAMKTTKKFCCTMERFDTEDIPSLITYWAWINNSQVTLVKYVDQTYAKALASDLLASRLYFADTSSDLRHGGHLGLSFVAPLLRCSYHYRPLSFMRIKAASWTKVTSSSTSDWTHPDRFPQEKSWKQHSKNLKEIRRSSCNKSTIMVSQKTASLSGLKEKSVTLRMWAAFSPWCHGIRENTS